MNDQQIRSLIQQEINKNSQSGRFNLQNIQRHTHNNIDSPYTFQPILTYGGSITSAGAVNFLPISFVAARTGVGTYKITHNLNTLLYVSLANANGVLGVTCGIVQAANDVTFTWYNGINQDVSFFFTLTVLTNKSQILPKYTGSLIL